jgi:hypothetical protein
LNPKQRDGVVVGYCSIAAMTNLERLPPETLEIDNQVLQAFVLYCIQIHNNHQTHRALLLPGPVDVSALGREV